MGTTTLFTADLARQHSELKPVLATLAGIVRHPFQTGRMLQLVNNHPALRDLPGARAAMLAKIHTPYLSNQLDCAARIALLEHHYDIVQKAGFCKLVQQASLRRLILCGFIGKSGARYRLELSTTGDRRRAGEWVLRLVSKDICVYTITFLFTGDSNDRQVLIGSLTGMLAMGRHTDHRVSIKQATWDCYGWQPRDMMVSLVLEIGACLECRKAVLVGNRNKLPVGDKRFCRKSSDYDRIWTRLNASARGDGNYELPCPAALPDTCVVQPHQMRTRRSMLVESLRQALRMRLADERSWPATVVHLPQFEKRERISA